MKVAALIRQRELEKRAFTKAIMGKGGKGGLGQSLGKAFSGFKDYAFGAAPALGAAAKGAVQGASETLRTPYVFPSELPNLDRLTRKMAENSR